MKYKITLIISWITISLFSQEKSLFDQLYEFQGEKIKIYLDGVYKVIYKECAEYYMICKINNQLEFTDSVHIYDLEDRIVTKGFFQSSKLTGNYISYFANGQTELKGNYTRGLRTGVWKYYYENGLLKKEIDFGDGTYYPILNSFFEKNGKQSVTNGNGKFKDYMVNSIASTNKIKYFGMVRNGRLHGIWKQSINGTVTGREIFDNGKFIKGTSFSVLLDDQTYSDNPISTIFELNYLERVKILSPSVCNNGPDYFTLSLSSTFYDDLYEILAKNKNSFTVSWYFLEIQSDNQGIFLKAIAFPKNDLLSTLVNTAFKGKEVESSWNIPGASKVILIVYFADDVYFSNTDKIENFILNFRF